MERHIIEHLFKFWEHIGQVNGFVHHEKGFIYTKPANNSWPNKIFGLVPDKVNLSLLYQEMKRGKLPKTLGVLSNVPFEASLKENGFKLHSSVKGMFMEAQRGTITHDPFSNINLVDSEEKAFEFAAIASKSFGYPILTKTIFTLISSNHFKLFIGTKGKQYVHCGLVYLDERGNAGIHMIGTLPEYQGQGLGKTMTTRLLQEVAKNQCKFVYLVASKAGERIYSKMGFKTAGSMASYTVH